MRSKFMALAMVFCLMGVVSSAIAASGYKMVLDIYDEDSSTTTRVGVLAYYDDTFPQQYAQMLNMFAPLLVDSFSENLSVAESTELSEYEFLQLANQVLNSGPSSLGWDKAFGVIFSRTDGTSDSPPMIVVGVYELWFMVGDIVFPYEFVGALLINEDYLFSQQESGGMPLY